MDISMDISMDIHIHGNPAVYNHRNGKMSYRITREDEIFLAFQNIKKNIKHKRATMGIGLRPLCPHITL